MIHNPHTSRLDLLKESAERSAKDIELRKEELMHHGILGMKWGVRRYQPYPKGHNRLKEGGKYVGPKQQYKPKGLAAKRAARANKKVDSGFDRWKQEDAKKKVAIEAGKKASQSKLAYEKNKKNKATKQQYKSDLKEYKKTRKATTHYREGMVRREVSSAAARKYLSEAKKVQKKLNENPNNKALKKEFNYLMKNYNIERASGRRAQEVGVKRSRRIASLKRAKTIAIKTAATTAGLAAATAGINMILKNNGKNTLSSATMSDLLKKGKKLMGSAGYFY